jgi:hypothetical protein
MTFYRSLIPLPSTYLYTPPRPHSLHNHIPHRTLHPKLRIQSMRKLHMTRHWRRCRRPQAFVENTLQSKLRDALFPIYLNAHLEQSIAIPDPSFQWTIPASNDY